jgi:Aminoglycoside-2''-adenylyltransferase
MIGRDSPSASVSARAAAIDLSPRTRRHGVPSRAVVCMNSLQVRLIHDVLGAAEAEDLPLWLESGWAIDARKLV